MDGQIIYSLATEADVPAILAIQEACGLSPWTESAYKEAIINPDARIYIAKDGKTAVGFIITRLITVEFLYEILNIGVISSQRKKKVGEGLLLQLLNNLDSRILKIWLEVREGNVAAISFYEKHGFKIIGKRKNFYRDPVENALLMSKEIH